jgi:pimeloyl-ACP methyl ester carboxylesterase
VPAQHPGVADPHLHRLEIVTGRPETTEPPPIEGAVHRFADAGGLRVHYAEAGAGEPVLLLHGWPQHHYLWRGLIDRLRDRYRLIAPDLRGFGWTDAPGRGYDCETFAEDQIALLDALGIERVNVIGHDWGGWTTWLLAFAHPDRLRRAIACNIPHPWPKIDLGTAADQSWRGWYAAINAMPVLGPLALRRTRHAAGILRNGNVGTPFTAEEIELYVSQFRDPARARAASSLYRYYFRTFILGSRGGGSRQRLTVPTRLLFGTHDRYISTRLIERGWQGHADDMDVELVDDSGHFIVDEKPDLVAQRAIEHFG